MKIIGTQSIEQSDKDWLEKVYPAIKNSGANCSVRLLKNMLEYILYTLISIGTEPEEALFVCIKSIEKVADLAIEDRNIGNY